MADHGHNAKNKNVINLCYIVYVQNAFNIFHFVVLHVWIGQLNFTLIQREKLLMRRYQPKMLAFSAQLLPDQQSISNIALLLITHGLTHLKYPLQLYY